MLTVKRINRVLADQILSKLREVSDTYELLQFLAKKENELVDSLGMIYNLMLKASFGWGREEIEREVKKWIRELS